MPVQYPGVIPDLLTRFGLNPLDFASYTDLLRELQAELNALGVNPQGTAADVTSRIAALEAIVPQPAVAVITSNSVAINNTTTETAFSNGSVTIPANSLVVGRVFRISGGGVIGTKTTTPGTFKLRLRWGSLVTDPLVVDLATAGAAITANLAGASLTFTMLLTCRSIGSSGTIMGTGGGVTDSAGQPLCNQITGPITINTTVAKTVKLFALWNTADPTNTVVLENFLVEQVN